MYHNGCFISSFSESSRLWGGSQMVNSAPNFNAAWKENNEGTKQAQKPCFWPNRAAMCLLIKSDNYVHSEGQFIKYLIRRHHQHQQDRVQPHPSLKLRALPLVRCQRWRHEVSEIRSQMKSSLCSYILHLGQPMATLNTLCRIISEVLLKNLSYVDFVLLEIKVVESQKVFSTWSHAKKYVQYRLKSWWHWFWTFLWKRDQHDIFWD